MNDMKRKDVGILASDSSKENGLQAPGAQLAAHREALGWSIEQVAAQLKLAPRQIQSLESDNYAALPGMAVVRGFVRAYAKILKLDASPLVAMITVESIASADNIPKHRTLSAPFSETRLPLMTRRNLPRKAVAGIAALVLFFVIITLQLIGGFPASVDAFVARLLEKEGVSSVKAVSPVTKPDGSSNKDKSFASNTAVEPDVMPVDGVDRKIPLPTMEEVGISGVVPSSRSNNGNNNLVLKIRQDSWVEIKRVDGSLIVARLLKAGTSENYEISGPVQLTVGNVQGVEASFRGVALEIRAGAGTNTARLNLK